MELAILFHIIGDFELTKKKTEITTISECLIVGCLRIVLSVSVGFEINKLWQIMSRGDALNFMF